MHLILIIIHYLNKMYPILKLIYLQFLPHNQYNASYKIYICHRQAPVSISVDSTVLFSFSFAPHGTKHFPN